VQDVHDRHLDLIGAGATDEQAMNRLCELNVIEQARNVCQTTVVRDAWARGQELSVHSWIYSLRDGLLRDLGFLAGSTESVADDYARAIAALRS
jgi:carbonic anhydrase